MASKAAKLRLKRAKAGRPRKTDAPRHPSGQINKTWQKRESEKEARAVVMEARIRVHGVSDENGLSGYTLGRIFLDGKISKEELEAGNAYAETIGRYYRLTGIPFPSARAQEIMRVAGSSGDVSESLQRRAQAATNRVMALDGGLSSLEDGRQVKTTVFNVCVMDHEALRLMPDLQLSWLKRGLRWLMWERGLRDSENQATKNQRLDFAQA